MMAASAAMSDAACGSDDEGPQRDDDGDEPGDRTPPPPRRVASATTLSVLAEGETPREGDDDAASQPEKRSISPVPPPDFGSESGEAFASEPVASGSRDRAEVVRALRKKPALGLKIERLSSITGPGLGGGGSPEAAESEGQDGAADAPEFWALRPGEARLMTCRTKISFPRTPRVTDALLPGEAVLACHIKLSCLDEQRE